MQILNYKEKVMLSSQVIDPVTGKSLDEFIVETNEAVKELLGNHNIRTYNKFESLGLTNNVSLEVLCKRLPLNSIFMCNVHNNIHTGLGLPINGGNLIVRKDYDAQKAYVLLENEAVSLKMNYNEYITPVLYGWRGDGGEIGRSLASDYGNKISNIKITNATIYFTTAEANKITDKPTDFGSDAFFVSKERYGSGHNFLVTLTKNASTESRWIRREEGNTVHGWRKLW